MKICLLLTLFLASCATFQKDKEEIKKVSHDLVDEALDDIDSKPSAKLHTEPNGK
jgi:hypothetical protein